jgi:hypothetical protein
MSTETILKIDDILYNAEYSLLHSIKNIKKHTIIISGGSHFCLDSLTNIKRFELPINIVKKWKVLKLKDLTAYAFLEKSFSPSAEILNHYCIKKKLIKKTIFYKDKRIIKTYTDASSLSEF